MSNRKALTAEYLIEELILHHKKTGNPPTAVVVSKEDFDALVNQGIDMDKHFSSGMRHGGTFHKVYTANLVIGENAETGDYVIYDELPKNKKDE